MTDLLAGSREESMKRKPKALVVPSAETKARIAGQIDWQNAFNANPCDCTACNSCRCTPCK